MAGCSHYDTGAAKTDTAQRTQAEAENEVHLHEFARLPHVDIRLSQQRITVVVFAGADFAKVSPSEYHASDEPCSATEAERRTEARPAVADELELSDEVDDLKETDYQVAEVEDEAAHEPRLKFLRDILPAASQVGARMRAIGVEGLGNAILCTKEDEFTVEVLEAAHTPSSEVGVRRDGKPPDGIG